MCNVPVKEWKENQRAVYVDLSGNVHEGYIESDYYFGWYFVSRSKSVKLTKTNFITELIEYSGEITLLDKTIEQMVVGDTVKDECGNEFVVKKYKDGYVRLEQDGALYDTHIVSMSNYKIVEKSEMEQWIPKQLKEGIPYYFVNFDYNPLSITKAVFSGSHLDYANILLNNWFVFSEDGRKQAEEYRTKLISGEIKDITKISKEIKDTGVLCIFCKSRKFGLEPACFSGGGKRKYTSPCSKCGRKL